MQRIIIVFFTALGVLLGGALIGGIGGTLTHQSPVKIMLKLTEDIKLWAVATAIGGTFSNLRILEGGFVEGKLSLVAKQLIILVAAFLGAQLGIWIINILTGGR
ncbi:YtrH family sporulation protein [Selenihalanaerobacter shriftii]|uniref:Sporulation protein YtrH n=1 Tax=Selenihalanaerobacter shriftii TaxID=142842 RepID=A0A1T4JQ50_9FIRM|nr:YtrH family sporulation protein [Selenihalanaerobacter shriftii]SJZ32205.1 Sporulation protein YtrH [Selenihalanaerobacter shriftii]